jgi:hypothetical protein
LTKSTRTHAQVGGLGVRGHGGARGIGGTHGVGRLVRLARLLGWLADLGVYIYVCKFHFALKLYNNLNDTYHFYVMQNLIISTRT